MFFTTRTHRAMLLLLAAAAAANAVAVAAASDPLAAAIESPARTPKFVARDGYRHPLQTLRFFGVRPDQTVVEIWPGRGWYMEILARTCTIGAGTTRQSRLLMSLMRPRRPRKMRPCCANESVTIQLALAG